MKKQRLSPEQAFDAMFTFLQRYYERTGGKGELGGILGDMQINRRDGLPFDPATRDDWLAAINYVLEKSE